MMDFENFKKKKLILNRLFLEQYGNFLNGWWGSQRVSRWKELLTPNIDIIRC